METVVTQWQTLDPQGSRIETPRLEPQDYSRNVIGIDLSGSLYSSYTPTIVSGLPKA